MSYPGSIQNFGDLQSAVQDFLYRSGDTNFQANAPLFIDQFEREFMRNARLLEMEQIDTATLASAVTSLPPGFLEAIRVQLTNLPYGTPNQPLTYVTPARAAALDSTMAVSGLVKCYTLLANQIVINPQKWVPTGATIEVAYYQFIQLANASGGVNWLIQAHPDLYLYGALMQGAAYIDDKETTAFWQTRRDAAWSSLFEADKKKKVGGPLQMSPSMNFRTRLRRYPGP